ncbi:MAG TPA: helix-turn-helix domain-containing protein [Solirubrobacterales bacterium]|nr:helix-turn-helix domain-containing protein [Solirubrobacterales bacterium]
MTQTRTSPEVVTQRLAKALAHPLRVRILAALHREVSSPNKLAGELGESVSNVSYHVKVLKDFECLELVKTRQRRGATEHFYRATERAFFDDSDWKQLPPSAQEGISGAVLGMIINDAAEAFEAGTFDARDDRHLSRTPLVLDEEGWEELNELLSETLGRALELQAQVATRMAEEKTEGITSKLSILHFESPAPQAKS